ncbi:uncharacterized protein (DUF58 family) [Novosphingobium kunmingense]|uniref:Uncharacterized protein (DUF58 family) n=1 Tax=Novosphingobium kunmingense TaxID=1211806 RepID=A0A2N0HJN9_9SPHN|nr:DUF58 domain-containing protein [Novosphingobium kunmingense]PKB19147.1 uncharacterized protein (DUF58 family) [Novosphingobium kunmingense]
MVPTARAAALIVAAAPLAVLIAALAPGAWVVAPLIGVAVLVLILADAGLAGRVTELGLAAPPEVEVGHGEHLRVHARFAAGRRSSVRAAVSSDARLLPAGRAECELSEASERHWQGSIDFVPSRRGTGHLGHVWLRWAGPLGLGARQAARELGQSVRVRPNLALARSPTLQAHLRDAQFGLIARRIRGEGTMFEALAEYQPGMDRRRIDWKASARHAHLYAKEMEAERNNQIVFAFDCGQAMCEPVGGPAGSKDAGIARIDRAVSAALAAAYVALKGGDRVALFGFAARPEVFSPFVADARDFPRLQSAAAQLDYHAQEPNFTLALATLAGRLQRRSLIVVFSDFTDPTSAQLMIESIGRLTRRHMVLFVTMADTELNDLATRAPDDLQVLAIATTADALLNQRALVLSRLRQLGVDVIEAPHDQIGMRLIDAYLAIKRKGAIG